MNFVIGTIFADPANKLERLHRGERNLVEPRDERVIRTVTEQLRSGGAQLLLPGGLERAGELDQKQARDRRAIFGRGRGGGLSCRFRSEDHLVAQADGFGLGRKRERKQEPNRKPGERTSRGTSGLHGFTVAQNWRWTSGGKGAGKVN